MELLICFVCFPEYLKNIIFHNTAITIFNIYIHSFKHFLPHTLLIFSKYRMYQTGMLF